MEWDECNARGDSLSNCNRIIQFTDSNHRLTDFFRSYWSTVEILGLGCRLFDRCRQEMMDWLRHGADNRFPANDDLTHNGEKRWKKQILFSWETSSSSVGTHDAGIPIECGSRWQQRPEIAAPALTQPLAGRSRRPQRRIYVQFFRSHCAVIIFSCPSLFQYGENEVGLAVSECVSTHCGGRWRRKQRNSLRTCGPSDSPRNSRYNEGRVSWLKTTIVFFVRTSIPTECVYSIFSRLVRMPKAT